jgi:hypothetical protein
MIISQKIRSEKFSRGGTVKLFGSSRRWYEWTLVKLFYLIYCHAAEMFLFPCFNPSDTDDPSVGLINGQLALPGRLLRREVFDPVMEEVWVSYLRGRWLDLRPIFMHGRY